ncbi:rCG23032 [Rattus norvegicus]|uniref:RCG23032 n=1 Tax=Rattus norvegicus TaxID=10116 RepID=A6KUH8_RAT|nr:rCG56792 [Rattus norvegicus]EDL86644.1 rCG23032 [Rattus norvegicus]
MDVAGSWEARDCSELSCVTLGKSPNLSVLQSPSCKWE